MVEKAHTKKNLERMDDSNSDYRVERCCALSGIALNFPLLLKYFGKLYDLAL